MANCRRALMGCRLWSATVVALLVIGGATALVRADSWTSIAPMPASKYLHGAGAGSDDLVYAFGGTADDGPPVTATVFAYDAGADIWMPMPSLPAGPRRNFAYARDTVGRVYAIGGYDFSGPPFGLSRVERYDPTRGAWERLRDMPTARQGAAAIAGAAGLIYVMGGTDTSFTTIATTEVLDPDTGTWTVISPMETPRTGFGAALGSDGQIYVFGGYTGGAYARSAEAYDPVGDIWTPVASMNEIRYSVAGASGPDGRIYAIGGNDGTSDLASVEMYDPTTDTWTPVAPMLMPRSGHAATLGPDGRIYAIGGEGGYPPLGSAEAYTP